MVSGLQLASAPRGNGLHFSPANNAEETVITLVVSVPGLSVQIVVALPIVSQAYKWRTRLLLCTLTRHISSNAQSKHKAARAKRAYLVQAITRERKRQCHSKR